MLKVFGRFIGGDVESDDRHLLYSDWHCSAFATEESFYILCDSQKTPIPCEPKQFCSNSSYLFILPKVGNVISFSKSQHTMKVIDIPCCRSFSANDDELYCISEDDFLSVYSLDNFPDGVVAHHPLSMKIKRVAAGPGFAIFLTPSGAVFSKGIGTRGQLGHGDLESRTKPEVVAALRPVTVTDIACGSWHSACLTDTGDIYTWGSNDFGQLGYPSLNLERSRNFNCLLHPSDLCVNLSASPIPVDLPENSSIVAVACGSRHTVCLSENGELFAFGWNGFGQLGFRMEPQRIPGRYPHQTASDKVHRISLPFPSHHEVRLSCGSWCTIIESLERKLAN